MFLVCRDALDRTLSHTDMKKNSFITDDYQSVTVNTSKTE